MRVEGDGELDRRRRRGAGAVGGPHRVAVHRRVRERRDGLGRDDGLGQDEAEEDYTPVVIRSKEFDAEWMTVEEAVDRMELVGHDFFLFIDGRTDRPSVVYRRKGWDYGVIALTASAPPEEELAS